MSDNPPKDPTAARIQTTMQRLGLSQAQMGAYLGVPQNTISNWMTGTRKPGAVVARFLDVLGMMEAMVPSLHATLLPTKGGQ